jgi:hypothetical protein
MSSTISDDLKIMQAKLSDIDLRCARKRCTSAGYALENVRDALMELNRLDGGGVPNPNWSDPGRSHTPSRRCASISPKSRSP